MSTVREILDKYHAKVPFPITTKKIREAGYDPHLYVNDLIDDIRWADDADDPKVDEMLRKIDAVLDDHELA